MKNGLNGSTSLARASAWMGGRRSWTSYRISTGPEDSAEVLERVQDGVASGEWRRLGDGAAVGDLTGDDDRLIAVVGNQVVV